MALNTFSIFLEYSDKQEQIRFHQEARALCSLYERKFPGLKVPGWRVNFELVEDVKRSVPREALGVHVVERAFDLNIYRQASVEGKQQIELDTLHSGLLYVARHYGWPLEPFVVAHDAVLEAKFKNQWLWPKQRVRSPDRTQFAQLRCVHARTEFSAWLTISSHNKVTELPIVFYKDRPDEHFYVPNMKHLKWEYNSRVVMTDRDGKIIAAMELPNDDCSLL
jgi:hypothetical protein